MQTDNALVEPVTMWRCIHCRTIYPTGDEASDCAARGWTSLFQPGDIVVDVRACCLMMDDYTRAGMFDNPKSKYRDDPFCSVPGIFPGNDPWIFLVGKSLHERPGIAPYWVVGAVTSVWDCGGNRGTGDKHRVAYHIFTEAGSDTPGEVGHSGWTTPDGHIPVMKPPGDISPELVERSKKYIGCKSKYLLHTY